MVFPFTAPFRLVEICRYPNNWLFGQSGGLFNHAYFCRGHIAIHRDKNEPGMEAEFSFSCISCFDLRYFHYFLPRELVGRYSRFAGGFCTISQVYDPPDDQGTAGYFICRGGDHGNPNRTCKNAVLLRELIPFSIEPFASFGGCVPDV